MSVNIHFTSVNPDPLISTFVESFWMLDHSSDGEKEVIVLPDGRIDLIFSQSLIESYHVTLMGIGTFPDKARLAPHLRMFAISFKPLGLEYILQQSISHLVDQATYLSSNFWDFNGEDLIEFASFCNKVSTKIYSLLPAKLDNRKQKLFELIFSSNGSLPVKELSKESLWSSRQINRYFTDQYGLSLKAYCAIIRFRASFQHIKNGKLFPEQNFTDQSHFIREVKKLSGVLPKELKRNTDDRFIQFSTMKGT